MKKLMKSFIALAIAICPMMASAQSSVKPNDTLTITIKGVGQEEQVTINGQYVVNSSGRLKLPYLDASVIASGSTDKVARRIEQAYKSAQIYTSATFTVKSLRDDIRDKEKIAQRFLTVGGQVSRSGPVQFRTGMTLYGAVSTASPNAFGAINRVKLIRNGKSYINNLELDAHKALKVFPNDQVIVPQKNWRGR